MFAILQPNPRADRVGFYDHMYERTREALEALLAETDTHPCWGYKIPYTNPVTGGWAMPTMGTHMQILPIGFKGREYRSTDSTAYAVIEGKVRCVVRGQSFEFGQREVSSFLNGCPIASKRPTNPCFSASRTDRYSRPCTRGAKRCNAGSAECGRRSSDFSNINDALRPR